MRRIQLRQRGFRKAVEPTPEVEVKAAPKKKAVKKTAKKDTVVEKIVKVFKK